MRNALLAALLTVAPASALAAQKVLLVHSYHPGYSWTDGVTRGVRQALEGGGTVLEVFYMDTKRRDDPEWKAKAGELAMKRAEAFQPDVVIAADDDAQRYFASRLAGREKPQVVFCGVNAEASAYGYPARNVTGLLERAFFERTVKLLSAIDPRVKRVAVLADASATSAAVLAYLKTVDIAPLSAVSFEQAATLADWKAAVKRHQEDADALVVASYHTLKGPEGPPALPSEVLAWTAAQSRLPVAGLNDFAVQDGALCAVAESAMEHGMESGRLAREILAGKAAGDIPIAEAKRGVVIVNLQAAKDLGLRLPPDVLRQADELVTGIKTDVSVVLSAVVGLVDERLGGILRALRVLAATQEARSGKWPQIQGPLAALGVGREAGVPFFVLPDGAYFTTANGLEKNSLKDRAYFQKLSAGKEVVGELVVSRSTGRKAAVLAVPVMDGSRVVGALGASLFADSLVGLIEEKAALPGDLVLYALTPDGETALHRDPRKLFEFPARLGSESMASAVNDILYKDSGAVSYYYTGMKKTVVFQASPLTRWRFALGEQRPASDPARARRETAKEALLRVGGDIRAVLSGLDGSLAQAAVKLSRTGLASPEARAVLAEVCSSNPDAVTCAIVDAEGRMAVVEPFEYRPFEGSDISKQEHVQRLKASKAPTMSWVFRAVQGFDAVTVAYPVLSESGALLGSVSATLRPDLLLANLVAPAIEGLPLSAWVMQEDGRIVYDPDEAEIGRKLFDDPLYQPYPGLLALGRRMAAEESGEGAYEFPATGGSQPVRKQALWSRLDLHGTRWTLVVTAGPES